MSPSSTQPLSPSFSKLAISKDKKGDKTKTAELADSWEDEADEDSSSDANDGISTPVRPSTSDHPAPPPPTPATSPNAPKTTAEYQSFHPFMHGETFDTTSHSSNPRPSPSSEQRRPDKTTSVASRLIAAGIGQKAPRRTQEQREYDQAMKLQEKKRRDEAKEQERVKQREKEQAQKDIWGD